ncbi:hypothetical protein RO3G_01611 [Lichtheimia corymbifera JMRC:FSU:9682]|uniref:Reverse transcriptase n=1 Tax=Lichtheimia corymbifera JMRC:FSU:9682 TaxID=1263082 RepID=A0A068SGV1_9FUNG|nr:hypothetical protein RO3G_01611 [Lichtheimia corymbifera JMRC:FSU:9682]
MAESVPLKWSQVVAKAAGMKVITPSRASRNSATMSSDTLFELPEFTQQQLARKAANIIRQALTPNTVLFSIPVTALPHHTEAYKLLADQIGPMASVRLLSNYDVRTSKDFLIAAKFKQTEHTKAAMESGVTIDDIVYKASPTAAGAENPLIRVQLNLLHNADDDEIKDGLLTSLRYYGKVYQIRRILCNGYFEGQLTVILDPSEGYMIGEGEHHEAQPLQRMLYLETWDVFAPASFKGADPICFYCRQAGHIRNTCPQLAKRVCFGCGETGHTRRFCGVKKYQHDTPGKSETELLDNYMKDSAEATMPKDSTLDKDTQQAMDVVEEEPEQPEQEEDMEYEAEEQDKQETTKDSGNSILPSKGASEDHTTTSSEDGLKELTSRAENDDTKESPRVNKVDDPAEMLKMMKVKATTKTKHDSVKRRLLKGAASLSNHKDSRTHEDSFLKQVTPTITKPMSPAQSNTTTRRSFINHLKSSSLNLDIICLQETSTLTRHSHLTTSQLDQFTRFMFPGCSSVITKHVAIICLRPSLSLDSTLVSMDERVAVASVKDQHHHTVCRVINVYAPADHNVRQDFLCTFLSLPFVQEVDTDPWILLGDFNMNLHSNSVIQKPSVKPWYEWIMTHFNNCFPQGLPTFTRGDSRTTIDYVYGHHSLAPRLSNAIIHFVPSEWTDHSLMTVDLLPARQDCGRGSWRFNKTLLTDEGFVALLDETISQFFMSLDQAYELAPQDTWESAKRVIKITAQRYTQGATSKQKHTLARLQAERQRILSDVKTTSTASHQSSPLHHRLNTIDKSIDTLIQRETHQAMQRSATRWHEQGERNNQYFYRVIKQRQSQQTIQSLRCPQTGAVIQDPRGIIQEARRFYQALYSPDDIHMADVDQLLSNIPSTARLSESDARDMIDQVSRLDLLDLIKRTPLDRSPGLDGLPFEVYRHLIPRSRDFCSLLHIVINQALHGFFPSSWFDTRMVLLYKKGDPELLANWRPLSLINTDAKLFTKLIANRINHVLPRLINPYQTGFMPHRLISDNGWLNQVIMTNARKACPSKQQVAIFLDQEKAYDRVHPEYLQRVLLHFGFPATLVTSLCKLFFDTRIHVSINGWLGAGFNQRRGLRQGDPLSPLLFNLAFEPMLRSIWNSRLQGVSFSTISIARHRRPTPAILPVDRHTQSPDYVCTAFNDPAPTVKMLSYADDLEVFLNDPSEGPLLMDLLDQYRRASNAKVNLSKTVMMSLSGQAHAAWMDIAQEYGAEWHDNSSSVAVRYLGYPLYHNQQQLLQFLDGIKLKISRHVNLLKGRNLSVQGAGMVANSLLLSRLWHVLRVIPAPDKWLREIKAIVRRFVLPFWPAPAWDTICLPRRFGGLGIIDIENQALALHFIYIQRLFTRRRESDFLSTWVLKYYQLLTGQASLLPLLLFPARFKPLLRLDPNMFHLCSLLCRLPQLTISTTWSYRWLLDLPLQEVIQQNDDDATKHRFPLRYILSDIVKWDPHKRTLLLHGHRLPKLLSRLVDSIWNSELEAPHHLSLIAPIGNVAIPRSTLHAPPWQRTPELATSLLPSLSHWSIAISTRSTCQITRLSLTQLRHIWHPSWQQMLNRPRPPERPTPSCLLYPPSFWKTFWKLPIPHKARTPWWRLLLDTISTRSKLHRLQPEKFPSRECVICKAGDEDLYHMFVDCPYKRPFWIDALQLLHLTDTFPNQNAIWHALVTLRTPDQQALDHSTLCRLGCIIATLWNYHWRCAIDNEFWYTANAMGLLSSNVLFSSFVSNTSNSSL